MDEDYGSNYSIGGFSRMSRSIYGAVVNIIFIADLTWARAFRQGFVIDRRVLRVDLASFLFHICCLQLPVGSHIFNAHYKDMNSQPYQSPHGTDPDDEAHRSQHNGYLDSALYDVQRPQFESDKPDYHRLPHATRMDSTNSSISLDSPNGSGHGTIVSPAHSRNQHFLASNSHQSQPSHLGFAPSLPIASHHGGGFLHLRSTSASHGSTPHYYSTRSDTGMSSANSPEGTANSHALQDPSQIIAESPSIGHFPNLVPFNERRPSISDQMGGIGPMMGPTGHASPLNQMQYSPSGYQNSQGEITQSLSPSQSTLADMTDFQDNAQPEGHSPGQPTIRSQNPSQNQGQTQSQNQNQPQQYAQQQRPVEIQKTTDIKARACDECRRRKTACYYLKGNDSKCFRCQMEDVDCTFSKRQGAQAGTAVTGVSGGTAGNVSGGRLLPISQRTAAKHATTNSTAIQSAGPIEDYSQLPGRSLLKKSLSLQHPRSSFSVGQHGLWDQRVLESVVLDKSGQARISANLSLRKVGNDSWFMVRNEGGHSDWIRDCDEIERTVYPYGRALVNSFFMFIHPEYPVLHEKIFIEKYLRTYRELMPALLGAVYLQGMRWWYHSPELATVARPHHVMPALYDLVIANFFKSSGGASLSLIQAGLLLLQCSFAETRHLSICSVINTTAYRLALNRNCLHWKLPKWEINLRLRLSWATYSQSTWISLFESIPPLTQDSSWFLSPLNADNFDSGTYEPSQGGALFIQINKLSLIVHDIHNLLSSSLLLMYSSPTSIEQATSNNANTNRWVPDHVGHAGTKTTSIDADSPAMDSSFGDTGSNSSQTNSPKPQRSPAPTSEVQFDEKSVEGILELIKPIQIRLRQWYNGLPTALANIEGENPTGNYSLRLAYIAAEVSLHRFIIRAVTAQSVPPAAKNPELLQIVKSSARDRLDVAANLIASLRPQHLQQFWYFASAYQFAVIGLFAALMYTTSDNESDAEYYYNMLRNFVSQLQMYSDSDIISAALRTLRSSIAGVPGLAF